MVALIHALRACWLALHADQLYKPTAQACLPHKLMCCTSPPTAQACLPHKLTCCTSPPTAQACLPHKLTCCMSLPTAQACLTRKPTCSCSRRTQRSSAATVVRGEGEASSSILLVPSLEAPSTAVPLPKARPSGYGAGVEMSTSCDWQWQGETVRQAVRIPPGGGDARLGAGGWREACPAKPSKVWAATHRREPADAGSPAFRAPRSSGGHAWCLNMRISTMRIALSWSCW